MRKAILSKVAGATATVMMATSLFVPTFADSHYTDSTQSIETEKKSSDGVKECKVYAEVGSTFEVIVPKEITLNGTSKEVSYQISCKGDIAGDEYVKVAPASTITMKQTSKPDVSASVEQNITMFRDNLYTPTLKAGEALMSSGGSGSITAHTLSAGSWEGAFNFDIALMQD